MAASDKEHKPAPAPLPPLSASVTSKSEQPRSSPAGGNGVAAHQYEKLAGQRASGVNRESDDVGRDPASIQRNSPSPGTRLRALLG